MDKEVTKLPVRELIFAGIICVVLAVCDIFCFPASLFIKITVSDITPYYFALMINQWFWIVLGLVAIRFLCPNLKTYIGFKYFKNGWGKFGLSVAVMTVLSAVACSLGLIGKYNYTPSAEKVFVEGIFYYISVGIIEELYIRALLLNIIERIAYKSKHATLIGIVISSVLFGLGHIVGMIGQDALTIICRVIWTISLGVYLGVIYKKSNNLWLPVIAHILIDVCALAFCFVAEPIFTIGTVIALAIGYFTIAAILLYVNFIRKKSVAENIDDGIST